LKKEEESEHDVGAKFERRPLRQILQGGAILTSNQGLSLTTYCYYCWPLAWSLYLTICVIIEALSLDLVFSSEKKVMMRMMIFFFFFHDL
jgi:hypothetical protein